jgi:cyclohexanecarboxyl-CoA dehydrogenase
MEFGLSDDQLALRDSVRNYARTRLAPGYLARAQSTEFPWFLHGEIAALGVFGLLAGVDHNPLETEDYVAVGLAIEELAYADFNLANAAIPVMLMSALIARHGSARVRESLLQRMVDGETYVALGLTEPEVGSDVANIRTTATATDTGYVISGGESCVSTASKSLRMLCSEPRASPSASCSAGSISPGRCSRSPASRPRRLPLTTP